MAFINWQREYEVGYAKVDDQHKELVRIINSLAEAMGAGQGQEQVGQVLHALSEYTSYHFAMEEGLMKSHDYPDYPAHRKIHESLLASVQDLVTRFDAGKPVLTVAVMNFLQDWLIDHIQREDAKLVGFLAPAE
jgi:hemerythrin